MNRISAYEILSSNAELLSGLGKKPVAVKYENITYELLGETHQVKKKLTCIAELKAKEAKAVNGNKKDLKKLQEDINKAFDAIMSEAFE